MANSAVGRFAANLLDKRQLTELDNADLVKGGQSAIIFASRELLATLSLIQAA
jgi:hypothetical protein